MVTGGSGNGCLKAGVATTGGSGGGGGGGGGGSSSSGSKSSTGRTASAASRRRTGRRRSQCDITTKIDISVLTNMDLIKDDLARVAYFVKELQETN